MQILSRMVIGLALVWVSLVSHGAAAPVTLKTSHLVFQISPDTGAYEILDRDGKVTWRSNPYQPRFGEVTLEIEGKSQQAALDHCGVTRVSGGLELTFHPLASQTASRLKVTLRALSGGQTLEFRYKADESLNVQSVRLLEESLWVTDGEQGYVVVPVREGLLIPADSGLAFSHAFGTYAYEGCHMEMLGLVKGGAAALVYWSDPYVTAEVRSTLTNAAWFKGRQVLSPSLILRKSAESVCVRFLGPGDYVTIAKAYRDIAWQRGLLVRWDEKLAGHPERARLFGAVNFKLWNALERGMNEESTMETSLRVHWTFAEAAQVAEHLKNDLKLDKVLFLMGGWTHRGYDNQHPDILPAAPECGGTEALAACARRVQALGYVFGLHDNYQDMYRDAPSWNEDYLAKATGGRPIRGGTWAGGRAYITCSKKAVELARRPQNLPAVRTLVGPDAYFIDTTFAAGLLECHDPRHPLTLGDDIKWKQELSAYSRELFGIFGSECGREWAIPVSDFFEGLTGVSGGYYHDPGLLGKVGGVSVPLFEIVYRDSIAMYGKYGYDPARAAEYVLHHISIGRPLNYHSVPSHLYWTAPAGAGDPLAVRPQAPAIKQTGPRQVEVRYRWEVEKEPSDFRSVFVHFTDSVGTIKFQNDYPLPASGAAWKIGPNEHGPFPLTVPAGLKGRFDIRLGLLEAGSGRRAPLRGRDDGEGRFLVGRLNVDNDSVQFESLPPEALPGPGDPGLFVRGDDGWTQGLCALDRFVKNTYEVLSPLNELTAELTMTQHQFLTPDRKARRSVFSTGADAVEVIVNAGGADLKVPRKGPQTVVLPVYGFLIESAGFVAFHATSWGGHNYESPVLFTLRSLDGRSIAASRRVRVYHAFGDTRVRLWGEDHRVEKEAIIER